MDTEIQNNRNFTINWDAPDGARSSCSLYIDYSINGGSNWLPVAGPIPYNHTSSKMMTGTYDWLVPNVTSNNCYLRINAYDAADNRDTVVSHQFSIDCYKPESRFSVSTTSGQYPLNVSFTDLSTFEPTSWLWNFGDGYTSTQQNPNHIYTTSGIYIPFP